MITRQSIALGVALLALSGCSLQSPVDDLAIRTPGSWSEASKGNEGKISTGWLSNFDDPGLKRSVNNALQHNRSLKAAAARLREAKETTIIARANQLPQINTSGRGNLSDSSADSRSQSYGLNLAASWEPDLWGRLRDLTAAAEADERAAIEDFRGARLSIASNAAKAYTNLVSAEQEVDLARFTLESFQKNLRIIERNYRATGEGALDIQFARTNVSSAQRSLEARQLDRGDAARTLEVLEGKYPTGTSRAASDLPNLPRSIPAGIPADLVERRADLSAARARLFASAKRADAARKNLLPNFSLTGSSGNTGARFGDLLNVDFLISTIAARVDQVIFDGGALEAQARGALARNDRQVNDYAQLALVAFREVEATLAADRSLAKQEKFLRSEVAQASLAEKQAERDYAEGINPNILSVLEAQRRANNARAAIIRLRNQRLQNRFDLYLALGGDFSTEPSK
ncbi:efflux transporter outer membrane subunit [Luteolibacter algae]|uniref:Efflux transporter outer membrane subunit n=1 Tax=Luteolibacter algae TaxID=454151 RepID=A0ABW5D786_9BACT